MAGTVEGQRLSHYTIVAKIGEGGMGAVYRATDSRLNRTVAIKILPAHAATNPDRQRRFVQEAQSASALNHPNIVHIYDIDTADDVTFIAMEFVDGRALDAVIADSPIPMAQALDYAIQAAGALAAAHQAGIVHRDVKPANILVNRSGQVKVLDFGLAKLMHPAGDTETFAPTKAPTPATAVGVVVGTPAYMSPEQADGRYVDAHSDVFSFGAVLYEMLSGRRAFNGSSPLSIMAAVLQHQPTPLATLCPGIPPPLDRVVTRCLEKDPARRYPSASELHAALEECRASLSVTVQPRAGRVSRPVVAALVIVALLAAATATWVSVRSSRVRWARQVGMPEVESLVARDQSDAAARLLAQVQAVIPDDPQLARLTNDVMDPIVIETAPPGVEVATRSYLNPTGEWMPLGITPLTNPLAPFGYRRWRLTKDGYEPREIAAGRRVGLVTLKRPGETPDGMVYVPGGATPSDEESAPLTDFWLDRYEVTNRQFKAFVDAGGYSKRGFWTQPFVKEGREIAWEDAIGGFRDSTGRPGPAGWELSSYPEGTADQPVVGVSWYEAAAYAAYAGKSLPTYWHWNHAAAQGIYSDILLLSNFSGKGLARVGEYQGLGAYGTFDMAGNAKEWCFNSAGSRRYILGGAWNEPSYMFTDRDAQDPFARRLDYGFRCAKYLTALPHALTAPVERLARDYSKERPATDEAFKIYQSLYAYDRTPLNASVEALSDDSAYWRREKVTIDAAYGKERMPAYLFLPRNATPPFQAVVFYPPGQAFTIRSSAYLETRQVQFLIQSGRAVLYPIYRGTFDRWVETHSQREERDLNIMDVKDFSRSVDYLETRPDIDRTRLGYYGISAGANIAPMVLANDHRIRAAVLLGGGLTPVHDLPEVDQINFVSRVTTPVLMLNGRYDFVEPVETSQQPMFDLLGTAAADKRHVIFETGHAVVTVQPMIKEVLDWLDKYLGPVPTRAQ
jgi:formylglycine-generating enzyme required for sulfatase activity/dienelactone hydrolase